MKKTLLFIALAILTHGLSAQVTELWGVSHVGTRQGSIFKLDVNKDFQHILNVPNEGQGSTGNLVEVRDGIFFGMTSEGGLSNKGAIFGYSEVNSNYQILHSFNGADGQNPEGSLILASDGLLYGITNTGGANNDGVIFSYNTGDDIFQVIHHFDAANSPNPAGTLLEGSDGKLYGITRPPSGSATIFSFDPDTKVVAQLYELTGNDGSNPRSSLIEGSGGLLYGATASGGSSSLGVLFGFNTTNNTYTKLHDFNRTDGRSPEGALTLANDGKLYGTTRFGGARGEGVLFNYDLSGSAGLTVIHHFDEKVTGEFPTGSLIQANDGKLYGLTLRGNDAAATGSNRGVLFSYDPLGAGFQVEHSFLAEQARYSDGSLIEGSNGKLYGISYGGGPVGFGMIYSYEPNGSGYESLHALSSPFGQYPTGYLIQAKDGLIYGLSKSGGRNNGGVIFKIDRTTNEYSKLYDFESSTGESPQESLVEGDDGLLYGVARKGGVQNKGVIFKYNINSSSYSVLYEFVKGVNGDNPASLTMISDGKLYGTTLNGGKSDKGVLFSYDLSGTYKKLIDFADLGGVKGYGAPVEGDDHLLYGTAIGDEKKVLYSYNPADGELTELYDFSADDGIPPVLLLKSRKGTLYGTTRDGGSRDEGTIFSYETATGTYTKLYDFFGGVNGAAEPGQRLTEDKNGVLYGMTRRLGSAGKGIIFKFNTADNSFEQIHKFRSIANISTPPTTLLQVRTCQSDDHILAPKTVDCHGLESPTIDDSCLGILENGEIYEFDFEANEGVTKDIVWTFDDIYGNYIEATQSITFDDVTNPVPDLEELPEIISDTEILESSIVIPTATDDCSSNITVTHDIEFPITRSVKINWTFDDNHGNKISQTQNVIVEIPSTPDPNTPGDDILSVGEGLERDFTVYPNPASGIITINSTSRELVQVLSLEGVVLLSSDKKTVDISILSTGIYIIKQGSKVTQFIKE
ncbi:choice-of-anchor tandem repeat GloVer-containing protein [Reichenbachiella versicolor]|uniref:choice-of-anchor tandem repeat GloVer-containing protein n=1 Tax=Reichenbachiella versicolor TaxID=1821036 RepID=UPI000D6E2FA1|nr:choice-of-anchor tandem repeat GloVer-containing protein [Reichenbachiella versicolor]